MMPDKVPDITGPCLLIVEGEDDKRFFESLLGYLGIDGVQVLPIGGKNSLRANLKALVRDPGFRRQVRAVAVVRDADRDRSAAFQSVCDALESAGLPRPVRECEPVHSSALELFVSVMILPDCEVGALEELCLSSVAEDPAIRCVDEFFECLRSMGLNPRNLSKARVQVFLASREEADKRLGEAAQAGYWPWSAEGFARTKAFLMRLAASGSPG